MANCLQVLASCSIPSSSSLSSSTKPGSFRAFRSMKIRSSSKIPMPPVDSDDPFHKRLFSFPAQSPEAIRNPPKNSDTPPLLDLFMATPANMGTLGNSRFSPSDSESKLLGRRMVFVDKLFSPSFMKSVVSQLIYLQWRDPNQPIYLYINSTGTTTNLDVPIALESQAFVIYDTLMLLKNEIYTVNMGCAGGQACLLLAAGTKGKRFSLPNATAMIQDPIVAGSGIAEGSSIQMVARDAIISRDTFVELFCKHTGNSKETITAALTGGLSFDMDAVEAKEFGVIDKIVEPGQFKLAAAPQGRYR